MSDTPTTPDPDPMPVFVLKAQDRLALNAIIDYYHHCIYDGLNDQAGEVAKAYNEFEAWRERNPERMKWPDHPHQPARPDQQ